LNVNAQLVDERNTHVIAESAGVGAGADDGAILADNLFVDVTSADLLGVFVVLSADLTACGLVASAISRELCAELGMPELEVLFVALLALHAVLDSVGEAILTELTDVAASDCEVGDSILASCGHLLADFRGGGVAEDLEVGFSLCELALLIRLANCLDIRHHTSG
jgi:hypothetical protein